MVIMVKLYSEAKVQVVLSDMKKKIDDNHIYVGGCSYSSG